VHRVAEKVTAFVTRSSESGLDLLLFEHPHAGIQIPAGTVEGDEAPEEAVIREVAEETGLSSVAICCYLGYDEERLPEGYRVILDPSKVYARPDLTSFDWAQLRRGIHVEVTRAEKGFSQVKYEELDRVPNPQYVSMCIIGWVPDRVLSRTQRRHFFHLESSGHSEGRWTVRADSHLFTLFWAPLRDLPEIVYPQSKWLEHLRERCPELMGFRR